MEATVKKLDLEVAPGWDAHYAIAPSTMAGANGIRFGPNAQLYVAQFLSSRVSAVDVDTGIECARIGGSAGFVAPDDIAFDDRGVMFATEVMDGRVSACGADGKAHVVCANLPGANGIAIHNNRIFVDEFRPSGRLLEVYADGRQPRTIVENAAMANALSMGPDGFLYYPAVGAGQIWRVNPDRGGAELFIDGLAMPTAVKFGPDGYLVVTQAWSGVISRVSLTSRDIESIAKVRPGIDNCTYDSQGRLFVSHFVDGGISEILRDGRERLVMPPGLLGPWGIDVDDAGTLYVADGMSLLATGADGRTRRLATFATAGFPGFLRNVIVTQDGSFVVSTSAGIVARYRPGEEAAILASGLDQISGLAATDDEVLVAEAGTGRVLQISGGKITVFASDLGTPMGIVRERDGRFVVSDAKFGRVLCVEGGETRTLAGKLQEPHGIVRRGDAYFVLDRGARAVLRMTRDGSALSVVAKNLPVGDAQGPQRVLPGTEILPGPLIGYGGIADHGGTLFVSCDAEGSVVALRQSSDGRASGAT